MRKSNFIVRLVKGAVIGLAAILPGASGGVLAVAMGVYRPVLDAVTGLTGAAAGFIRGLLGKNAPGRRGALSAAKGHILYLIPLGIGGVIGLLSSSRAVEWLLQNYRLPVMWLLIGMVLGGVPSLVKEANARGFKARYLLATAAGVLVIGGMAFAQTRLSGGGAWPLNGWTAAFCGALIGLGTVVPGVSTSFIMMYFGIYEPFLAAFNRFDIGMILCAGLGVVAVVALLIALVKRLFDRHYGYAYYGVLGFLLASVALIYPGTGAGWGVALNAVLFAAGAVVTYLLCRLPDKDDPAPDAEGKKETEDDNA